MPRRIRQTFPHLQQPLLRLPIEQMEVKQVEFCQTHQLLSDEAILTMLQQTLLEQHHRSSY